MEVAIVGNGGIYTMALDGKLFERRSCGISWVPAPLYCFFLLNDILGRSIWSNLFIGVR